MWCSQWLRFVHNFSMYFLWLEMELSKKTKHQRLNLDDEVSGFLPPSILFRTKWISSSSKHTNRSVWQWFTSGEYCKLHKSQFDCFHTISSSLFPYSFLMFFLIREIIYRMMIPTRTALQTKMDDCIKCMVEMMMMTTSTSWAAEHPL